MKRKKEQQVTIVGQQPAQQEARRLTKTAPKTQEFDAWWAGFASKYGVKKHLKPAIEIHMKARGYWENKDWKSGIQDFGYLAE